MKRAIILTFLILLISCVSIEKKESSRVQEQIIQEPQKIVEQITEKSDKETFLDIVSKKSQLKEFQLILESESKSYDAIINNEIIIYYKEGNQRTVTKTKVFESNKLVHEESSFELLNGLKLYHCEKSPEEEDYQCLDEELAKEQAQEIIDEILDKNFAYNMKDFEVKLLGEESIDGIKVKCFTVNKAKDCYDDNGFLIRSVSDSTIINLKKLDLKVNDNVFNIGYEQD